MYINIAGAGSGKTTQISKKVIDRYVNSSRQKNIYCIAYTNNAIEQIRNKLQEYFGFIPDRIIVGTIHSFLYQELIKPYYYLLYGKHYTMISNIHLPEKLIYRNKKIRELENENILHISTIPQRAKWVLVKKSGDVKYHNEIRGIIKSTFTKYCESIFVDEAQDIDDDVFEIFKHLDSNEIYLEVMGDPKQDLRGYDNFRRMIELNVNCLSYITECYRCPQIHLNLSNIILREDERQKSAKTNGSIRVVFESQNNIQKLISDVDFDLMYISSKNERFETHESRIAIQGFETLFYEIKCVFIPRQTNKNELEIASISYYLAIELLSSFQKTQDSARAMAEIFSSIRLSNKEYAIVINALQNTRNVENSKLVVSSIEAIKGQEGENCLFILTNDLAAYLFQVKTDENKTKNKLYVALTRSLDKLTIYITKEVEIKYGHDFIVKRIGN